MIGGNALVMVWTWHYDTLYLVEWQRARILGNHIGVTAVQVLPKHDEEYNATAFTPCQLNTPCWSHFVAPSWHMRICTTRKLHPMKHIEWWGGMMQCQARIVDSVYEQCLSQWEAGRKRRWQDALRRTREHHIERKFQKWQLEMITRRLRVNLGWSCLGWSP